MLASNLERAVFDPSGDGAFLAELGKRSPVIQNGFAYWQSMGWPDRVPRRDDLKPFEIPKLIPHAIILDVLTEPLDFLYRLIGTEVVDKMARDRTGQKFSEITFQRPPSKIWEYCEAALSGRCPVLTDIPYVGPQADFLEAQDLVLPLADDAGNITKLLVFVDFIAKSDA